MSCPFFHPEQRFEGGFRPHPVRLPLGDCYEGTCLANDGAEFQPGRPVARDMCNFGYARETCARFPAGDGPDAVRFNIGRNDGVTIRLDCVLEKDHRPHYYGRFEYSLAAASFASPLPGRAIQRQAEAYVASYLRRTAAMRQS